MKALVTGGTGFIGSHLIERLVERGDTVSCIARDAMNIEVLRTLNVTVILGDLNNGLPWDQILSDVDIVYHVAGVTRSKNPEDYFEGNHQATHRLVDHCLNHAQRLQRFVFVSSLTAAGPSPDGRPITEEMPCHPVSDYGESKRRAENELLKLRDRLPVTIVRPSAVYGPREREWYDYIKMILHGIQPLVGVRDKYMSMIHCDDLVDGIMKAGDSPKAIGQTYFLAHDQISSVKEIGKAICAAVHTHPLCVRIPHCAVYAIGAMGEFVGKVFDQDVFFNIQKVRESVQRAWICSVDKAREELGFAPRIPLLAGMAQTCTWYREHGWL